MDRRQKKSQTIIFNVFLDLLKTKRIEEISITELAEISDLSRGTIYANFLDKYEILEKIIDFYLNKQFSICSQVPQNTENFFSKVIELMMLFLKDNTETYIIFFNHPDTFEYRTKFIMMLSKSFISESSSLNSRILNQTEIQFMCHGIVGVMSWYVMNYKTLSIKEVIDQLEIFLKISYLNHLA